MKKFLIFGIIFTMLTSCVRSVYEITYVDTAIPTDTLMARTIVPERFTFPGEDTGVEITADNVGMSTCPVLLYKLKISNMTGTTTVHVSHEPIKVISFKYLGEYNTKR